MSFYLDFFSLMSPTWVAEDSIVYLVALIALIFVINKYEKKAVYRILELVAFVGYAAIYENLAATILHLYSYGPSILMIGNVPLSVPLFEGLILMGGFILADYMNMPTWCKPIFIGFLAMLQDLSLDPVSVSQIASVGGSFSGRWQWLIVQPGMVSMFNEPLYNWSGWMLMIALAAASIYLGRWLFKKSDYNKAVGYIYPFGATLLALLLLISPLSGFVLWLGPFFAQGGFNELFMLAFWLILPVILLLVFWRGRMKKPISLKETWPIFGIFIIFHISDIIFAVIGGYWNVLPIALVSTAATAIVLLAIYLSGRKLALSQNTKKTPHIMYYPDSN